MPTKPETPIIMVGPGTGVAPFIAFCEERESLGTKSEALLYFGCRHSDIDYIYKEEIGNFKKNGQISHLREAFSRQST